MGIPDDVREVDLLLYLKTFLVASEGLIEMNDPVEIDALEQHFEDAIKVMDIRFTTHEFFLRLAHDHQREYVAGLSAYSEGGNPFRDLHHALVKRLKRLEGKLIALRKESYPSRDIFGTPSHSGLWRKL